jgi:hypothetical protein
LGAALLGAGFVPGSLLARPALGALGNTALAGLCAAISFAAAILLPRTRGAMKAFS